jgi:hypothetical protein
MVNAALTIDAQCDLAENFLLRRDSNSTATMGDDGRRA